MTACNPPRSAPADLAQCPDTRHWRIPDQPEDTESMRLHHAGISVPDLDRSLTWYCEALGLRPGFRFEVPPIGLRGAFALGEGSTGVELLEMAGAVPGAPKMDPQRRGPARISWSSAMCFRMRSSTRCAEWFPCRCMHWVSGSRGRGSWGPAA